MFMLCITPENYSYLIGFIQGDGHLSTQSRNRGKITIELAARDIDILDKIEKLLSEQQIYVARYTRTRDTNFSKENKSVSLSVFNREFRKHISNYIPYGKKSKTVRPPINIPNFKKYDYIRGITDADGSLGITSFNRPFWSLCTSSEYIKSFLLKEIENYLGIIKHINKTKRDNVYNITLFDEAAVTFVSLLYKNSTIFLNRKYNKYLDIQNWVRTTPKRKGCPKIWLEYEDKLILNNTISFKDKCKILNRTKSSIKTRQWRLRQ